jgi:hypothetical protein
MRLAPESIDAADGVNQLALGTLRERGFKSVELSAADKVGARARGLGAVARQARQARQRSDEGLHRGAGEAELKANLDLSLPTAAS